MLEALDYWKFFAGLGLFLFGMLRIELALKELAGKRFKLFIRKYTTNRFLAILNGAFASAILQSSAIVLIMIISFAGAGIISLSNSLGVILGANIGTTMTGWFVSTVGFNAGADSFVSPLIAISSLALVFVSPKRAIFHVFGLLMAIGFLLLGLGFMKTGMSQLATIVDIRQLEQFGPLAFFFFGFVVTAIIQSSTAMMTITLSALHANIIGLEPAVFVVIGADLGTTMTALLASAKGTAIKKRVGLAHFFFNVGSALVGLVMAKPFVEFILRIDVFEIPLYQLVSFHTALNLMGMIMFFPFLGLFEKFLNRFFMNTTDHACQYIHKVNTEVPEASIEAVRLELELFASRVFSFNSNGLSVLKSKSSSETAGLFPFLNIENKDDHSIHDYEQIKRTEGELLEYVERLQQEKLERSESIVLNRYILNLRQGVQSAKAMKDIQHNLKEFRQSVDKSVELFMSQVELAYEIPFQHLDRFVSLETTKFDFKDLRDLRVENQKSFELVNEWIYKSAFQAVDRIQIASFLNVNREIYNSNVLFFELLEGLRMPPLET